MADAPHILFEQYVADTNSDLFMFSGSISEETAEKFITLIHDKQTRRPAAAVFLTTYGGDPHSAYRMTKCLKRNYGKVRLLIPGPCKSAGTLVALGVSELAFGASGELGPLDTQIAKPDQLIVQNSGLDIFQAMEIITGNAFQCFEDSMLRMITKSGGNISTKTAAEIATKVVVGLFTPISAQIDPLRLGEVQRAINIAKAYGKRLASGNTKPNTLDRMVQDYPSHGFVIDMEEAKELFTNVSALTTAETAIYTRLKKLLRYPAPGDFILDLEDVFGPTKEEHSSDKETHRESGDTSQTGGTAEQRTAGEATAHTEGTDETPAGADRDDQPGESDKAKGASAIA